MIVSQDVLKELLRGEWCWLERTLMDDTITHEYLPRWMAEWLAMNDAQNGVTVKSARVIQDVQVLNDGQVH